MTIKELEERAQELQTAIADSLPLRSILEDESVIRALQSAYQSAEVTKLLLVAARKLEGEA